MQLVAFFYAQAMIYQHYYFIKKINKEYWLTVFQLLGKHITRKRPHFKKIWILHQDSIRPHTAKLISEYLEKVNIPVLLILRKSRFGAFRFLALPILEKKLRGCRFNTTAEIQRTCETELKRYR